MRERAIDEAVRRVQRARVEPVRELAPILKAAGRHGEEEAEARFAGTVAAIRAEYAPLMDVPVRLVPRFA